MWQRPPYNPPMPVPTYHPEDGAHSHTHSPRKRSFFRDSKSQGFQPPFGMGNVFQPQPSTSFFGGQPFPMPFLPRGNTTSSSLSFPDSFNESAYFDWVNSLSSGQSSGELGKAVWPTTTRNTSKQSSTDTSMPDYMSNRSVDAMHISGPSLEDDPMSLKVPTNTPTAGPTEDAQGPQFNFSSYGMSSDLATSLTHSLLNQPLPLPIPPHAIPLPSSEIKSRKENRHLNISGSNPASTQSTPHGAQTDTRKFSQPVFGIGGNLGAGVGVQMSSTAGLGTRGLSPNSEAVFTLEASRNSSANDFGVNLTNNGAGLGPSCSPMPISQHSFVEAATDGNSPKALSTNVCNVGSRRARNFTPISAKVIDEEDEPRKSSSHHHVRATGHGEEGSVE